MVWVLLSRVLVWSFCGSYPSFFSLPLLLTPHVLNHTAPSRLRGFEVKDNNSNRIQRHNFRFFFFTISLLCCEPSPTHTLKWPGRNYVQITCNTLSACHVQHVVLCATLYEGTAQLLRLTEFKLHLFELCFIG